MSPSTTEIEIPAERYLTVPLFQDLEPLEIMEILRIAEDLTTEEGQPVVQEGDAGDGFYVIGKGAFEVRKHGAGETVLARLEELSFFGEMALVTRAPRSASVVCVEPGRLKHFPTSRFEALLADGSLTAYKVIRNMSRILAQRLSRVQQRLVQLAVQAGSAGS